MSAKPNARKTEAQPPPKLKVGRPPHVPNEKTRLRVMAWAGGGIEQETIALSLDITRVTLAKHYKRELAIGRGSMDGLAISTLAVAMQRGGKEGVAAAKWWTQSRMGWTEKLVVDDNRANVPMRVIVELVGDPAPVTIEHRAVPRRSLDAIDAIDVELVG